jgi:integrase
MPRLTQTVPRYRLHRQSGQAVVTLNGRDHLLGPHGTKASRREYDRLITEWLTRGRQPETTADDGILIVELIARYWRFAKGYYVKRGKPTDEQAGIRGSLRPLKEMYGDTPAAEFSPLGLKAVRATLIEAGLARTTVNQHVSRIRRMFRWAVSEELVPESTWRALNAVDGLRKGRTEAREPEPVLPVADELVDATLPHLPEIVGDMVRLQRLTGMRPNEVCQLRPCDLDRSGADVWLFRPGSHKTQHHGRERVVAIGPQAQAILLKYLARSADDYCFQPRDSESKRRAAAHANRKTPISCGDRPGTNRVRHKPRRRAGEKYTTAVYTRAIVRACQKAFPLPEQIENDPAAVKKWKLLHYWSANRLRHSAATEIRSKFGIEAVQHVLGHSQIRTSEIYAEKSLELAAAVAKAIG